MSRSLVVRLAACGALGLVALTGCMKPPIVPPPVPPPIENLPPAVTVAGCHRCPLPPALVLQQWEFWTGLEIFFTCSVVDPEGDSTSTPLWAFWTDERPDLAHDRAFRYTGSEVVVVLHAAWNGPIKQKWNFVCMARDSYGNWGEHRGTVWVLHIGGIGG